MKTQPILKTLVFCAALSIASIAESDVVTDWNTAALNAIRADKTPPPIASRALAILHASIYDAVNGIVRSHEPYFVKEKASMTASQEAAASAAAHKVLMTLFPANAETFEELHKATLAGIRHGPHKRRGLEWGESVADQILLWRANDNSDEPPSGSGPQKPGEHHRARGGRPRLPSLPYLLPHWGLVTPFAMPTSDFFRPNGPPALESAKYAADYNEVKGLGAAVGSSRTPEQTEIALFWADGAGTVTPPGHWNVIAQDVATARRNTMRQNARLFALLNIAMADAAICAWDAKYHLQLLASGHRDSRGRHRSESSDGCRSRLELLNHYAPISGLHLGPQYIQWRSRRGVVALLWNDENSVHHRIGRLARCRSRLQKLLGRGT